MCILGSTSLSFFINFSHLSRSPLQRCISDPITSTSVAFYVLSFGIVASLWHFADVQCLASMVSVERPGAEAPAYAIHSRRHTLPHALATPNLWGLENILFITCFVFHLITLIGSLCHSFSLFLCVVPNHEQLLSMPTTGKSRST